MRIAELWIPSLNAISTHIIPRDDKNVRFATESCILISIDYDVGICVNGKGRCRRHFHVARGGRDGDVTCTNTNERYTHR